MFCVAGRALLPRLGPPRYGILIRGARWQPSRPLQYPLSRSYQQMASPPPKKDDPPKQAVEKRAVESESVTAKEQRQTDWRIIKTLVKHVWPKNDWKTRGTVVFGFGLLISSKVGYAAGDMH